jgi:hypothetical protein
LNFVGAAFAWATRSASDLIPEANDEHVGRVDELRDRDEILERIVRQVLEQRRVDGDRRRGEEQRVAVGRRPRRHAHAGVASGARPVVDDDGLAQRSMQRGRENVGDDVGRPARRERHDQGDRPFRIGGARGQHREHRQRGDERHRDPRSS